MQNFANHASGSLTQSGLFCIERGSGRPIVMLHGLGETMYLWRYLAPHLELSFAIHLIDLKGHGRSRKPFDNQYSLLDHLRLIRGYIEERNLRDVTVIGHSMGGGVAALLGIWLAEQGDRRLRSLILIDSIMYPQAMPFFVRLLRIPFLARTAMAFVSSTWMVRLACRLAFFDPDKIREDMIEEYARPLRTAEGRYALAKTAEQLVPDNIETILSKLKLVTVPTLLIWGENDRIVPPEVGRRLERDLPQGTLRLIPQCGHLPPEEHPERLLTEVERFLHPL